MTYKKILLFHDLYFGIILPLNETKVLFLIQNYPKIRGYHSILNVSKQNKTCDEGERALNKSPLINLQQLNYTMFYWTC